MVEYLKEIINLQPLVGTKPTGGIRYNPLKLTRKEFERLCPLPLTPALYYAEGYRIEKEEGFGNHPLHLSGGCYLQEPSAMSAITALGVQNGDRVLDLCAAPGSKATALAAQNPDGITVANEIHPRRAKILMENFERMGIAAALITSADSAALLKAFGGYFDKILVDAPCSGEGMFRKYPEILDDWNEGLVRMCAERGAEILENAAGMLRPGGRLVFSTCTFNMEENEKTVADFLSRHPEFAVVPHGIPGAHPSLPPLDGGARLFPDQNGEGHFVCALQKDEQFEQNEVKAETFTPTKPDRQLQDVLADCVELPLRFYSERNYILYAAGQAVYAIPENLPKPRGIYILRAGVQVAGMKGKTYRPAQHLFTATPLSRCCRRLELSESTLAKYLAGETIPCEGKGFTAVTWQGLVLGFGKAVDGNLKNHYPKGLRI